MGVKFIPTPEQLADAHKALRNGRSRVYIASILGCHDDTVLRLIKEGALPPARPAAREDSWPHERVVKLRNLWIGGLSAREISEALGVSKNAVIGMASRSGCPKRPSPIKTASPDAKPRTPNSKPLKPRKPKEKSLEKMVFLPGLVISTNKCQFPLWRDRCFELPEEKRFCSAPSIIGRSYCPKHCAICFVPLDRSAA